VGYFGTRRAQRTKTGASRASSRRPTWGSVRRTANAKARIGRSPQPAEWRGSARRANAGWRPAPWGGVRVRFVNNHARCSAWIRTGRAWWRGTPNAVVFGPRLPRTALGSPRPRQGARHAPQNVAGWFPERLPNGGTVVPFACVHQRRAPGARNRCGWSLAPTNLRCALLARRRPAQTGQPTPALGPRSNGRHRPGEVVCRRTTLWSRCRRSDAGA